PTTRAPAAAPAADAEIRRAVTPTTRAPAAAPAGGTDGPGGGQVPAEPPVGRAAGRGRSPVGRAGHRVGDPVGVADGLRRRLADEIATCLSGPHAGTVHGLDAYVGWHGAQEAAACPARYRAGGEEGWGFPGWSAPLAAAAAGRAALDHHLNVHDRSVAGGLGAEPPCPAPVEAVRAWMRAMATAADCGVGDWVAERIAQRDDATVAATAAGAARWLGGFVRVMGWPLPPRLRLLSAVRGAESRPLRWRVPGLPAEATVTVAAGADARLGKVAGSGDFALVVHRVTAGDDGRVHDRAAFEAAAGALAIGIVPAAIFVTAADTGERLRVPVDAAVLDRGAELIAGVVRQRVAATERGFDPADATPSAACRHCPLVADCPPGQEWLAGPGRWRGGLPVV
ncbi:MAG TPA: hypothetical protein VIL48_14880, partial [Acidimicrobiales bacterium]